MHHKDSYSIALFTNVNSSSGMSVSTLENSCPKFFSSEKNPEISLYGHQWWQPSTPSPPKEPPCNRPPSYRPEGTMAGCSTPSSTEVPPCSRPSYSDTRGHIFSYVRPSYVWAVSYQDSSMHRSQWVLVAHGSFIEGSHTTKNTAWRIVVFTITNCR